ncbi:cell wall hydrolase [Desulfurispora thermophila]|uniref:cell wall hydrolase n=1 Tax=Desulfurispora thermophila TaxID=265470 RepID=UPI0003761B3A|nr:cell wall hydrolase [Desulfurispora thermophila]
MCSKYIRWSTGIGLALVLSCSVLLNGAQAGVEPDCGTRQVKSNSACYTVRPGDTLSGIARQMGVPLAALMRANRLSSSTIYPDQILVVPGHQVDWEAALSRGFSRQDVYWLAKAIYAEARGEPFAGQVAVGAVILNRVKSGEFPDSIAEVILQQGKGTYQFSPVQDGSIKLEPDEMALQAAVQAICGWDPTGGALFFYNPHTATDTWIRTLPVVARIGNHVFARKA